MVSASKGSASFKVEHIGSMFDHAEEGGVAVFVAADFAQTILGKKTTIWARLDLGLGLLDGVGEVFGSSEGGREKVESESFGRAGADARELAEGGNEAKCRGRVVGHQRSTIRASKFFMAALMAGSLRKVSLPAAVADGGDDLAKGVLAGVGWGVSPGVGLGEDARTGREAADSARVSAPGTANFLRMVSRLTRSRISQRRRMRISRATSRASDKRR